MSGACTQARISSLVPRGADGVGRVNGKGGGEPKVFLYQETHDATPKVIADVAGYIKGE